MDAYVIVGEAEAGKSSLVRALAGIRNHGRRLMADASAKTFVLWAKDSSLQEAGIPPGDFIASVNLERPDAVLCTLWPRGRRAQGVIYPDHLGYLQAFSEAGWSIKPLVALGSGPQQPALPLPAGVTAKAFSNPRTSPFNTLAASVRKHWHWR